MPIMKDFPSLELVAAACIFGSVGLGPHDARADVLEIGPRGAVWKTAGEGASIQTENVLALPDGFARDVFAPDVLVPDRDTADENPDRDTADENIAAYHANHLTSVDPAAGPDDWRPHVAALASKYDISPSLLEALVWQESRWNARAKSPAGARGLAQLMPGTARALGVNSADPRANLEGGARYLRMQLDRFDGDVEKALAAYNAGPLRVERAKGMPRIRETRNYVAAIMTRLSQLVRR